MVQQFPEVSGYNLEKNLYKVPADLEGKLNLLIIPFQRWHQELVDEWAFYLSPFLTEDLKLYEIPTLNSRYKIMRWMIDGGMRAGISDIKVRQRTITLYINKGSFKKALDIPNEDTIYLFLIRPSGDILWRAKGRFRQESFEELKHKIEDELNF
jgi:hypothetical protein